MGIGISNCTAVIVAGGTGQRMNSSVPKSMICVNGKSLLYYCVNSVKKTGIEDIIIVIDDIKYEGIIKQELDMILNCRVTCLERKPSTFLVLRHYVPQCKEWILFLYGHAPRPFEYLKKLISSNSLIVASAHEKSTKKSKIILDSKYLEPPYFLKRNTLVTEMYYNWEDFFSKNFNKIMTLELVGPPEFNFQQEFNEYTEFVKQFFFDV